MYAQGDPLFEMPRLGVATPIAAKFFDCGRFKTGGMDYSPLEWVDVSAYSQFNPVDSFEAECIISMSRSYVAGLRMKEENRPPYQLPPDEWTDDHRAARSSSMERQFDAGEEKIKRATK